MAEIGYFARIVSAKAVFERGCVLDERAFCKRDGEATAAYKVPHTSYVVVIDRAGKVVYTGVGGKQDIEAALRKAGA